MEDYEQLTDDMLVDDTDMELELDRERILAFIRKECLKGPARIRLAPILCDDFTIADLALATNRTYKSAAHIHKRTVREVTKKLYDAGLWRSPDAWCNRYYARWRLENDSGE